MGRPDEQFFAGKAEEEEEEGKGDEEEVERATAFEPVQHIAGASVGWGRSIEWFRKEFAFDESQPGRKRGRKIFVECGGHVNFFFCKFLFLWLNATNTFFTFYFFLNLRWSLLKRVDHVIYIEN